MQSENRNLIIFMAIAFAMILGWEQFIAGPADRRHAAQLAHDKAVAAGQQQQGVAPNGQPLPVHLSLAQARAASPRIAVDTPQLAGSIDLTGAAFDDLLLKHYRETVAANSPPVQLLRPQGVDQAYFALLGWTGTVAGMPDQSTVWTATSTGALTPTHPVDLTYAAPSGMVFHRHITVDAQYLFTITDSVQNTSAQAVNVAPYGVVERVGVAPDQGKLAKEGAIGMFDRVLQETPYPQWKKNPLKDYASTGGWLGVTDKYWMTVFVPNQAEAMSARFQVTPTAGADDYNVSYRGQPRVLQPGATASETTHMFAGAKVVPVLQAYGKALATPRLEDAIDWGWFQLLTKPLFLFVEFLKNTLGSFSLALLALTVVIRGVFFPLYGASYEMSTKMKKVQPELTALRERYKDDAAAQQKEMMAIYAREKINPVTGCVPALLPIPALIALTSLFSVTIEMRQAPFFGWITDMSAPDPTTVWNLFGLIPWDPGALPIVGGFLVGSGFLHVGAWPLVYGLTLWLSMSIAPPAAGVDPTQQRIMQFMPLIFTFFLAHNASGLVIYWSWSSVFTIIQQYVMMRRFKVENPIDQFFARFSKPKGPAPKAPGG